MIENNAENRLITIAVGHGLPETLVSLSFLEAYGFTAFVTPLHMGVMNFDMMIALGGLQINVPAQQHHAVELLDDIYSKPFESAHPILRCLGLQNHRRIACFLFIVVSCFLTYLPCPDRGIFAVRANQRKITFGAPFTPTTDP